MYLGWVRSVGKGKNCQTVASADGRPFQRLGDPLAKTKRDMSTCLCVRYLSPGSLRATDSAGHRIHPNLSESNSAFSTYVDVRHLSPEIIATDTASHRIGRNRTECSSDMSTCFWTYAICRPEVSERQTAQVTKPTQIGTNRIEICPHDWM